MKLALLCPSVLATLALAAPLGAFQDYQKFVADFRQAMSTNDGPHMTNLVKSNSIAAAWHVDRICTAIADQSSEELEIEAAALRRAWSQGRETGFAENYYAYLSLMRAEDRRERKRFKSAYTRAHATFQANAEGEKNGPIYTQVAAEMASLSKAFVAIGDHYSAGNCWVTYAACYNEGFRADKEVELDQVTVGYQAALEAFDRADIKHATYAEVKEAYDRLTAEGWKEVADNPDAPKPGEPKEADPALAISVPMSFEALEEIDQFQRPNYMADMNYQMWQWLQFGPKGSEARFPGQKVGPVILRTATMELGVDSDRDGNPETPVRLTGNLTKVECELVDDGPPRKWAFMMMTGRETDNYQGRPSYMAAQDAWVNVYYVAAGSVVGELAGTPLRMIDENCDAVYGSFPWSWEYLGLTADNYHWEMDSMVIGNSKRAIPWSEFTAVGDQWYKFESKAGGMVTSATPVELQTGKLKLSYKGPPVSWLVVRGAGRLVNSYYDVLAARGGIDVPVGSYSLMLGEVRKGKKEQAMKALIMPGHETPTWKVTAGKTTVIELGAPFGFDFKTTRNDEGVTVTGKTVVIVGKHGERYERPWNCVSRPEVAIRKVGAKKGNKPEKMDVVLDMLAQDGDGGFKFGEKDTWFPLDTTFPFVGEAYEVQLTEKKNPLFGKLESAWK